MKQKLLSLTFLLFLTSVAFSQSYVPMLENNPAYIYRVYGFGWTQTYQISPPANETIGGTAYKKFTDLFWSTDMYFREDVAAKKVYKIIDGTEVLFFDFSLPVGGIVTLGNGSMYQLTSITDVNVYGGTRRRFDLQNMSNPFGLGETWIEGVGNLEHPLMATYQMMSDPVFYLECSYSNWTNVYNQGLANGGTPTNCSNLSIGQYSENAVALAPNPFASHLTIRFEQPVENASILLINTLGETVRKHDGITGGDFTVMRDALTSGIYLLRITENGKSLIRKVMVTD